MTPDSIFPSTVWGQIRPGGPAEGSEEAADANALDLLARRYWRPIVAFLRARRSLSPEDARDLAQDFFVWMIESGFLKKADPARGRFRAFLKTALRHFAADDARKHSGLKRGGGRRFVPLSGEVDGDEPEREPAIDVADHAALSPDAALDAAWRAELVGRAIASVESNLRDEGRGVTVAVFRDYFLDPGEGVDYRALALRHGLSAAEVSNHLQRAKALYRARLKSLVLDTVRTADDLEEELLWLFGKEGGA